MDLVNYKGYSRPVKDFFSHDDTQTNKNVIQQFYIKPYNLNEVDLSCTGEN